MSEQPKKSSAENQRTASSGKDEMNLVDFPIATLHHRDNRAHIECTTWHSDPEKGRYQQKWIVAGNSVLGLPHEIADQTVLALILIWHEQGAQKTFSPTIYRILKILNLPDTQHYYELLKKTLLQLDGLRIRSERAFWDNQKRQHVSLQSFGLFDSMRLAFWVDEEGFDESEEKNQIEWSTPIWKSLQAGYLKAIDLSFYLALNRPLTRRLYRFLDKQLRYRHSFEIDVFTLASRLGMQSYAFPSKVQEKLKPAIDELLESGFLTSAEFRKTGQYVRVNFVKTTANNPAMNQADEMLSADDFEPDSPEADNAEFDSPDLEHTALDGADAALELLTDAEPEHWRERWQRAQAQVTLDDDARALWRGVLTNLKAHVPRATFAAFIEPTLLLALEDNRAIILVGNPKAQDWLQNRFLKAFKDELNMSLRRAGRPALSSIHLEVVDA